MTNGGWIRAILSALALLAVAACSITPPPPVDIAFPSQAATETFAVGYGNIAEKYIEPVAVGDLALDGMRGLATIDPALTVERHGAAIRVAVADRDVARFDAPADQDPRAWAALTTEVSLAGRRASPELRAASAEMVYEAVFDSLLANLDVFSRYAGAEQARRNRAQRTGFGGIGIRFRAALGEVRVTEVMEDTPAQRIGLKEGDRIIAIDGEPASALTSDVIVERLRGTVRSHVLLRILRDGVDHALEFDIERAHIVPTTVVESFEGGILVLTVSRFNQGTSRSMSRKIKKARLEHGAAFKGIVLDLRGNPGGLLKQSIKMADLFLAQGEIVRTRGRHPESMQYYEATGGDMTYGLPVVVLVDGKSASAAEISAAALQDRGRAVVIGTNSYGKGTVQTVIRLPNDGEITLTWSRFVTPSGYVLHQLGVPPTVCTSRLDENGPDPFVTAFEEKKRSASLWAEWHMSESANPAQRQRLRDACPAERRSGDLETTLARRLIGDKALYDDVLDLAHSIAAANP